MQQYATAKLSEIVWIIFRALVSGQQHVHGQDTSIQLCPYGVNATHDTLIIFSKSSILKLYDKIVDWGTHWDKVCIVWAIAWYGFNGGRSWNLKLWAGMKLRILMIWTLSEVNLPQWVDRRPSIGHPAERLRRQSPLSRRHHYPRWCAGCRCHQQYWNRDLCIVVI